ncbi:hypothetical protein GCM10009808_01950 [Microbacterium sediminicola]|uniref:Uncharacterized protein n=1 Tax=Microbacterium sediminicola TaxID=415210 RepID=A0ABN2HIS4_9MICO
MPGIEGIQHPQVLVQDGFTARRSRHPVLLDVPDATPAQALPHGTVRKWDMPVPAEVAQRRGRRHPVVSTAAACECQSSAR